eukprot:scaffold32116_cov64-Phaeocystis_antarctica.AAC.4
MSPLTHAGCAVRTADIVPVKPDEGVVPDRHERGRLGEVEACKLGVVEGVRPDRRDRARDHELALKVSAVSESVIPDRHERGRFR